MLHRPGMSFLIRTVVLVAVLGAPGSAQARAREKVQEGCPDVEVTDPVEALTGFDPGERAGEEIAPEPEAVPSSSAEEEPAPPMRVSVSGQQRPITSVRLHGLKTLTEERVWQMVGARPSGEISSEHASALVARLGESGLFASVTPTLDVVGDAAVLDVALVEHPVVSRIVIEGLTEVRAEEILEAILDEAPVESSERQERKEKKDRKRPARGCPVRPPPSVVAHRSAGQVAPGIVWNGLRGALDRGLAKLFDHGYAMATIEGELSTDGTLTLHVDEGHLEGLDLQGVEPSVEPEVRKILGIKPGDVFLLDDVREGVRRVRRALPFLETDSDGERHRPMPQIAEERLEDGRLKYRTVDGASQKVRKRHGGVVEVRNRTLSWSFDKDNTGSVTLPSWLSMDEPPYVAIQGRRATVRFRPRMADVDWEWAELLRHTQVQGFAPGALLSVSLLDPENRGHLTIDGGLWLNTARAQERIDYLVGGRLRVPWLRIAEIGAQRYSLTDTSDGWRATPFSSYLGSALLNRPDREYYRRDGFSAMFTLHLGERLVVGAEYRNDLETSMAVTDTAQSLFNRREAPWTNAAIDEGRVVSALGRLEWSSMPVLFGKVGGPLRSPERSLFRDDVDGEASGWRTLNTIEVADERLGGDLFFTRLSTDTWYHLRTGGHGQLRARLRAAGGIGLPAQKMESLGGWTALRGYDFKEFRGDASVLVTAEYQWTVFSAFVDVGSVRGSDRVWSRAKVGVGTAFNLGDFAFAAAWRTDERSRVTPDFRLVFQRTY